MKTVYRYTLDKSNKKHRCPDCGKNTLVLYIDTETEEYLPEEFGRCDRESKCSYHLNPYREGYAKMIWMQENGNNSSKWKLQQHNSQPKSAPESIFIPNEVLKQTLQGYEKNVFIQNLLKNVAFPFEHKEVEGVISHYNLGTICEGYMAGGVTFPFIDKSNNIRAVQVKQFNQTNHTTGTDFLHSVYSKYPFIDNSSPFDKETVGRRQILPDWIIKYRNNDLMVSCLFGEHLLSKYPSNPIALVEAPKTAIYGTLYFGLPESSKALIWLAVYNKSSFSFDKLKVLQGRDIFVFPDLSKDGITYKEWETKAKQYEKKLPGTRFMFSDLLEKYALEQDRSEGNDLADYLIKMDWRLFRKGNIQAEQGLKKNVISEVPKAEIFSAVEPIPKNEVLKIETIEQPKLVDWSGVIVELESYFSDVVLPTHSIEIASYSKIIDISLFINSHLATVKANNGKRAFLPYLNRLQELKQAIITNQ